ncbi:MAG: hypothetical protein U0798_18905 [Gemmataceae bacterium]
MVKSEINTVALNGTWPMPTLPPGVRTDSLFSDSLREINEFKWYRSEEAGRDLGEMAVRDWVRVHWSGYLRTKWLEHLQGKTFWIELKRCEFGILQEQCDNDNALLNRIIDKLKVGQENLDIIQWAVSEQLSLLHVHRILTAVDINSLHLCHQFDDADQARC